MCVRYRLGWNYQIYLQGCRNSLTGRSDFRLTLQSSKCQEDAVGPMRRVPKLKFFETNRPAPDSFPTLLPALDQRPHSMSFSKIRVYVMRSKVAMKCICRRGIRTQCGRNGASLAVCAALCCSLAAEVMSMAYTQHLDVSE